MLLKYMFHPRVNPVCVKVVGNLHQIIEFGMAKKLGWSYLHEIACLSTPYYTLLDKRGLFRNFLTSTPIPHYFSLHMVWKALIQLRHKVMMSRYVK